MSKVFLIGRHTDLPLVELVNNFEAAKRYLQYRAFNVVNPVELHHAAPITDICQYLRVDIKEMMTCHIVAFLPDYQECSTALMLAKLATSLCFNTIFLPSNIYKL